jgi:NADP-dependent 3-hydroxy acid dehydrogenase YdfG
MQNFENKVVVITGAASGIGRAPAEAFLRERAKVMIADIDADSLSATRGEPVDLSRSRGGRQRCLEA